MPRTRRVAAGPEVVDVLNPQSLTPDEPDTEPGNPDEPPTPPPAPGPTEPVLAPQQLTPEQRRIRELEHQLAKERGHKDPATQLETPTADGENILIHFLEDGFTALGQVWYRGQELEFTKGSAVYRDTCDRNGRSWLDLCRDDFAQVERYGRVMFRSGPWGGKSYKDAVKAPYEQLKSLTGAGTVPPPSEDDLAKAAAAEQARRRAAPRLPAM
jgi:hypothetical protein